MANALDLSVNLESPLPASVPAGATIALFCFGTASIGGDPVTGLELLVDGEAHPVGAVAMPRFDVTPRRSGFWAVVPVRAAGGGSGSIRLAARVHGGGGGGVVGEAELGTIAVSEKPARRGGRETGLIAICMATYEPPQELLRRQLQSLREQTDRNWVCVISDDGSSPERYAALLALVEGDTRFSVSRSEERLGFYRNFERALGLVPAEAELVALCDQDDVWYPQKLATLRERLGTARLVYSDQRLVDEDGRVLRDTLWVARANNRTSLASMLIANTVTGAAALMRAETAARMLPFPDSPGIEFHDHWLSLVALASGDLAYVETPLYDYVQHPTAVVGKMTGRMAKSPGRSPLRMNTWRTAYFVGYVPGQIRALTLLHRCAGELTPAKRRALERYLACDTSLLACLWLLVRPLRRLAGRTETLGTEWELLPGLLWRRLAGWVAVLPWWPDRLLLDCRFPHPPIWRQKRLERWRSRS